MNDTAALRQRLEQLARQQFRDVADLREKVARLERENRALAERVEQLERQPVFA